MEVNWAREPNIYIYSKKAKSPTVTATLIRAPKNVVVLVHLTCKYTYPCLYLLKIINKSTMPIVHMHKFYEVKSKFVISFIFYKSWFAILIIVTFEWGKKSFVSSSILP